MPEEMEPGVLDMSAELAAVATKCLGSRDPARAFGVATTAICVVNDRWLAEQKALEEQALASPAVRAAIEAEKTRLRGQK